MSLLSKLKEKVRRKREEVEIQGVSRPKKTEKIKRFFTIGRGIAKEEKRRVRRVEELLEEAEIKEEARKIVSKAKKAGVEISLLEAESYVRHKKRQKEREKKIQMVKSLVSKGFSNFLEATGFPEEYRPKKGKSKKKGKNKAKRNSGRRKGKKTIVRRSKGRKSTPMILRW